MAKIESKVLLDYCLNYFKTFEEAPLNELDFAVFAKFCYFNYSCFIPNEKDSVLVKDIYDLSKAEKILNRIAYKEDDFKLFAAFCGNPRFRNLTIKFYSENTNPNLSEQFAAVTFITESKQFILAFRGTDATINGWKEDFDMSFKCPVPSQVSAVKYVETVGKFARNGMYLTGHSKGGNLAVYGFLKAKSRIRKRVLGIYDFDGPSFDELTLKQTHFEKYKHLIKKYVPSESLIGMIYEKPENCIVILSDGSGILQHNIVRWNISLASQQFVRADGIKSSYLNAMICVNEWVQKCDPSQKALMVDTLYTIVQEAGFKDVKEILQSKIKSLLTLRKEYKEISKTTREEIAASFKDLLGIYTSHLTTKDKKVEKLDEIDTYDAINVKKKHIKDRK